VEPKAGRAVFWPSVLNRDPSKVDSRTKHEAMPVTKGEKFAANVWLHMYDFKAPFKVGCTG
jgi:predicted 2-oxoglutarate/Fe(II)-dependent dioxygenase YbiX